MSKVFNLAERHILFHLNIDPATLSSMADVQQKNDEELMLAYQQGQASAFEMLYQRYKGPLYRFILRQCNPAAIAEELFQDVWVRIIKARHRYQPTAKFSTYLYTIANHCLIDFYRRNKYAPKPADDSQDELANIAARENLQPEQQNMVKQQIRDLLLCMSLLPEAQRQVFLLKEEAGLALEEIAHIVNIAKETAKSRLRYAMQKLRQCMEEKS